MKINRSVLLAFGLLILASSLYRVWPDRPFGFAPQWAMAVFAGAVIRNRAWAFVLPLISMLVSDTIYQFMYQNGTSEIWGFYEGQFSNYLLFGSLVFFGMMIRQRNWLQIFAASFAAPSAFFLVSNLLVWMAGGGYARPTLMMAYADGIPFYQMSLVATPLFSTLLFGAYFLLTAQRTVTADMKVIR
ncbi:MAG TPA: DUF6580 family putative transport protein [Flavisolibacter sp.]